MLTITQILAMSQATRAFELRRALGRVRRADTLSARRVAIGDYWALRRFVNNDAHDAEVRATQRSLSPEELRRQRQSANRAIAEAHAIVERVNRAALSHRRESARANMDRGRTPSARRFAET